MEDIKEFEGLYKITDDGRVWSCDKPTGQKGRYLKQRKNPGGYFTVWLSKKSNVVPKMTHRLVAESFIPREKGRKFVNHKNGIKTDNRVENLEWCTQLENNRHAWSIGLCDGLRINKLKGEKNGMSKLNENKIRKIRELRKQGLTLWKIAAQFNVSKSLIWLVCKNKVWNHIK